LEALKVVKLIYEQLRKPKTKEELYKKLNELGLKWSKAQVELFISMDKNIIKKGDTYRVSVADNKDAVLDLIDKIIGTKPMIPIKKVMENVSKNVVVSAEEILKIALDSGRYESPNGAVLKKIK